MRLIIKKHAHPKSKHNIAAANLLVLSILLALIAGTLASKPSLAQTLTPVSAATVTASATSGGSGFGYATTDTLGFYNITTFLDSGNYSVKASATGFIDTTVQNVRVTGGQETPNINLLLPVSGGITGQVTDAISGAPIPFVMVQAVNTTSDHVYSAEAYTDSNGNYQLMTNLGTGRYSVNVTMPTGHLEKTVNNILVTAGSITNNVNLALARSATISGIITDAMNSQPLSDIIVYVMTSNGSYTTTAFTNSSGKYTVDTDLGTGSYNVSVLFPPGHLPKTTPTIAVFAGNQYTVNVSLDRSGTISGRVTSTTNGTPISGATITATSITGSFFGVATTNDTGYYSITDGLGTGTYVVFASFEGGSFNSVQGISVTQGQETPNVNVKLTIAPSGTITGRVTDATTGTPLFFAQVQATGIAGSGSAVADYNGIYTITGLATGTYNVTASDYGSITQTKTGINVVINQVTSDINFQLQAAPSGRISGIVQTAGTAIPEFHSELYMLAILITASTIIALGKLRSTK